MATPHELTSSDPLNAPCLTTISDLVLATSLGGTIRR